MDTDVIVVGAGLAGLVATAELADAGRRVILLDQEPAASLGGQAFWSFGGLFLVDSPEQRRLGIRDSVELALQDWLGSAGFDRGADDPRARTSGPRQWATRVRRLRGGREAALAARGWACGSSRSWGGPSAAATSPTATATRCPASTSRGAPGPASSSRSSDGCGPRSPRAGCELRFRHRVDELAVTDGVVTGVRGAVLEASDRRAGHGELAGRGRRRSSSRRRR